MLRQMKQLGINAKFMGGDGICTGELPKLAGDAMADGQVVCAEAGGVEGAQKKGMDDFAKPLTRRSSASTCRSTHRTSTTRS